MPFLYFAKELDISWPGLQWLQFYLTTFDRQTIMWQWPISLGWNWCGTISSDNGKPLFTHLTPMVCILEYVTEQWSVYFYLTNIKLQHFWNPKSGASLKMLLSCTWSRRILICASQNMLKYSNWGRWLSLVIIISVWTLNQGRQMGHSLMWPNQSCSLYELFLS